MKMSWHEISEVLGIENFIIAGGAIRSKLLNEVINDYDCFIMDEDSFDDAFEKLKKDNWVIQELRANSVKMINVSSDFKLDIVKAYFKYPDDIINDFDLLDCCHYEDKGGIKSKEGAKEALFNKDVIINKLKTPYSTLGRIGKRFKKGWNVNNDNIIELANMAIRVPWNYKDEEDYLDH